MTDGPKLLLECLRCLCLLGGMKKFFSPVGVLRLAMLPTEVLGDLLRGEFGFANVTEVSGKVNGFS